jgi:hypothetical protein
MIGRKLCYSCKNGLDNAEQLYGKWRKATDTILDNYILGQKAIDADLAGIQVY